MTELTCVGLQFSTTVLKAPIWRIEVCISRKQILVYRRAVTIRNNVQFKFTSYLKFPLIIQFISQHNNIDRWKVYCILIAMNIFLILTYATKSSLKANHWLKLVRTALEAWIYCKWFRGNSYWSILITYIIESLQHLMNWRSWRTI